MKCVLGMGFITQNNVLIEGHNRLIRIPSKSGIVRVKAQELPCVGGPTITTLAWARDHGKGNCKGASQREARELSQREARELS
jgi:hypothetical protein